jgi:homoserine O-acetyltransferase
MIKALLAALALTLAVAPATQAADWPIKEGDVTLREVAFKSGERLAQVRMHYATLGTPHRDAQGQIDNAVMLLHGTGGSGKNFLSPLFADELFGPGQPLDLAKTYVIMPDNIGHGGSSKPSDGLRMAFPRYDYDDMVALQHRLLVEGLGVTRLKLILGTSMGCMHAFVWGETYPGFAERLAPFACNAIPLAGRNRMWRKMAMDAIRADPSWKGGNYTTQPTAGLLNVTDLLILAGGNPLALQARYPTREASDKAVEQMVAARAGTIDANDALYYLDASRNYDPSPGLEKITVPVLWVNSADDFINPPELGLAEQLVKRMPKARFVLIPASTETRGHGTHTAAAFWKKDLAELLAR